MKIPKVFVLVVTYHGLLWYDKLFTSLRQSSIPVEVIVVNNGGSDGTREYLQDRFPEIIILDPEYNLGFGKGNNLGLRFALEHGCDYVFLLNQDTWLLDYNTIEELVRIHKDYPEFGILSPMHLRANEAELGMMWENGNNECSKRLVSDLYCGVLKDVYETNYVNAAAWLLPRKTLETVGGFDPVYKHYEEDDDYLNRVIFHHFKIGVCPYIRIVHDHKPNGVNPFEKKSRYHHEQELYVKLADPNSSLSPFNYQGYYIRKIIKSVLLGNIRGAHKFWQDLLFVFKVRRSAKFSKLMNSKIGPTWIS